MESGRDGGIAGSPARSSSMGRSLRPSCWRSSSSRTVLREDLKPIEQAKAYKALMELNGWSPPGRSRAVDRPYRRGPGPGAAVAPGRRPGGRRGRPDRPQDFAYELTKIDDPSEEAEAAREAAAGRLRRDDLAERTRKPREGRGGRPGSWSFATDRVKVVVSALADDVSDEELTEAIAAALKERRKKGRSHAA